MDTASLAQVTILSGVAVALVTEILKSKYIPVPAQRYKRLTALVLSLGTSAYAVQSYNHLNFVNLTWQAWLSTALLTLLVSSVTYNQIIKTLGANNNV